MPDCDNWTAAMVLRWVLAGDLPTVLAMAEHYGATVISEDGTSRPVVPDDVDAVMKAYCIDPELPSGQQKIRKAVLRGQRAIAAREDIYRALRRGDLQARARRNGTGDTEKIESEQWLSLKFQSWNGHDLAVPINVERDVLKLPKAFADYIGGGVPADILPAVWPDPHFAAEQVRKIWPFAERSRTPVDGEALDQPYDHGTGRGRSEEQTNRPTRSAQTKCESWLRKIGVDELVKKSKPYWRSKATAEIPRLSGRGFDRAWGNVAAEFPMLSKAGAKPKKNN